MNFTESQESGFVTRVSPSTFRSKSLRKQGVQAIKTAKLIPLSPETASSIFRELYEGFRQHLEVLGYEQGYKFHSHESLTYFIMDILRNRTLATNFEKWRNIRNGINYYGDDVGVETVKKAVVDISVFIEEIKLP